LSEVRNLCGILTRFSKKEDCWSSLEVAEHPVEVTEVIQGGEMPENLPSPKKSVKSIEKEQAKLDK